MAIQSGTTTSNKDKDQYAESVARGLAYSRAVHERAERYEEQILNEMIARIRREKEMKTK